MKWLRVPYLSLRLILLNLYKVNHTMIVRDQISVIKIIKRMSQSKDRKQNFSLNIDENKEKKNEKRKEQPWIEHGTYR